jgi:DNA-binding Xre family transcriptional regulator
MSSILDRYVRQPIRQTLLRLCSLPFVPAGGKSVGGGAGLMFVQYIGQTSPGHWGKHLVVLRTGRGWTLRELADKSGVSRSRLSQVERGVNTNLSLENLLALQRSLGLDSIEALLGDMPSASLSGTSTGTPRPP